jgi:thioredoxin-related protein
MIDKNRNKIFVNDWVYYTRASSSIENTIEVGKIIGQYQNFVIIFNRRGCIYCDDYTRLQLLNNEEAMLRLLES